VRLLVIPTDEELMIAQRTRALLAVLSHANATILAQTATRAK
jgi:hypothetical protein